MLERILDRYRLRWPVWDDFTFIDAAGKLVQAKAVAAEILFEGRQLKLSQVFHGLHSEFGQLLSRDFADSRQASNGQWQQKRIDLLGLDDKEPVGLAPVRSEFCQELVGRYT